jgi:hypothetical protein
VAADVELLPRSRGARCRKTDLGSAQQRIELAHDLFEFGKPIAGAINRPELASAATMPPRSRRFSAHSEIRVVGDGGTSSG